MDATARPSMEPDVAVETRTVEAGATQYFLESLRPSTLYYISLVGRTVNGPGVGAQIEVLTSDLRKPR